MKTLLISMPWARRDILSIQLGGLTSYLRDRGHKVETRYYYKDVVSYIGMDNYSQIVVNCLGDLIFYSFYNPEKKDNIKAYLSELCGPTFHFDELYNNLDRYIIDIMNDIEWNDYSNVAFTTSLVQFIPSLLIARKIKEKSSKINIIMGGASLVGDIATCMIETFEEIDFVVKGEGEQTLDLLLHTIESEKTNYEDIDGLVFRDRQGKCINNKDRILMCDISKLPVPNFDEYFTHSLNDDYYPPIITVESSRGCFWGKCSFCNLNSQWKNSYREKEPKKVAAEIKYQAERYKLLDFFFTDSNVSNKIDLFDILQKDGIEYNLHAEVSGHLKYSDFVNMRAAGMRDIQIGIEAFSGSLLRKYKKGVSVMRNIEMLKWCCELGISVFYNIITGFPTTTKEEVNETLKNMQYAQYYQFPEITGYCLSYQSEVYNNYREYKIKNWKIPENVACLYDEKFLGKTAPLLSAIVGYEIIHDEEDEVDWRSVVDFSDEWRQSFEKNRGRCGLTYYDGGSFIIIKKSLYGRKEQFTLEGIAKDFYLFCIDESKSRDEIYKYFFDEDRTDLDTLISELVELEIMFCEDNRCFSLAIKD